MYRFSYSSLNSNSYQTKATCNIFLKLPLSILLLSLDINKVILCFKRLEDYHLTYKRLTVPQLHFQTKYCGSGQRESLTNEYMTDKSKIPVYIEIMQLYLHFCRADQIIVYKYEVNKVEIMYLYILEFL